MGGVKQYKLQGTWHWEAPFPYGWLSPRVCSQCLAKLWYLDWAMSPTSASPLTAQIFMEACHVTDGKITGKRQAWFSFPPPGTCISHKIRGGHSWEHSANICRPCRAKALLSDLQKASYYFTVHRSSFLPRTAATWCGDHLPVSPNKLPTWLWRSEFTRASVHGRALRGKNKAGLSIRS